MPTPRMTPFSTGRLSTVTISTFFGEIIRLISLFAAPFWLTYNLASYALGSAIGNALTIASIIIAMIKYQDFRRSKRA